MRSRYYLVSLILGFVIAGQTSPSLAEADWTLMIYMNGKSGLEEFALANYREMAKVGSSPEVNVVVELGRPAVGHSKDAGNWGGVLRFRVLRGEDPTPENRAADLRANPQLSDMGSEKALENFILWSMHRYPAKKYGLVIWNHGYGWRLQAPLDAAIGTDFPADTVLEAAKLQSGAAIGLTLAPRMSGVRSISRDGDTGHILYNSDVKTALTKASNRIGKKVDIVGFDACLMSMIETAYALGASASVLIASEEDEPDPGWNYEPVIRALVEKPTIAGVTLGQSILAAYEARYGDPGYERQHGNNGRETMSLVNLQKVYEAAKAISHLGTLLISKRSAERENIVFARSKLAAYGADDYADGGFNTSVDFVGFAQAYSRRTADTTAKEAADNAVSAVSDMILSNYSSTISSGEAGSKGLAIYFPLDYAHFKSDPEHVGYLKGNMDHPVDFVKNEQWADFIQSYLH